MKKISQNFTILWECLTGVRIDEPSKVIRLLFFSVLAMGIFWAVYSYYRSISIANLHQDSFYSDNPVIPHNDGGIGDLADHIQGVIAMRHGGKILAESINNMNRRLFNDDANYLADTAPDKAPEKSASPASSDVVTIPGTSDPLQVTVKAVLIAGKDRRAVIDTNNAKGLIIRQGGKIPSLNARVTRITKDGVTLRINGLNFLASFGQPSAKAESNQSDNKNGETITNDKVPPPNVPANNVQSSDNYNPTMNEIVNRLNATHGTGMQ
ncbi:MAG: hypothetical protein IJT21_00230 [Synergistaceae bacterium]|nr:hypothetical protein [Synergistaceae bacterium]